MSLQQPMALPYWNDSYVLFELFFTVLMDGGFGDRFEPSS